MQRAVEKKRQPHLKVYHEATKINLRGIGNPFIVARRICLMPTPGDKFNKNLWLERSRTDINY